MKEENILEVHNQDNKVEKIEVLKYFTLNKNNKEYIIYKTLTAKVNSDALIFSAEIVEKSDSILVLPIEDKEIENLIKDITEKLIKGEKNIYGGNN